MRWALSLAAGVLLVACGSHKSDGASTAGGSGALMCEGSSITFKLSVAPGSVAAYSVGPGGLNCGRWWDYWLSIRPAGADLRQALPVLNSTAGSCTQLCSSCNPNLACPAYCLPAQTIGSDGVQDQFDGRYLLLDTCGINQCESVACAPVGEYVARLCAYPGTAATPTTAANFSSSPTCFDVLFSWPPAASGQVFERTLSGTAVDAGDADAN